MTTRPEPPPIAPPEVDLGEQLAPEEIGSLDVSVIVPILTGDAELGQVVEALGAELDRLGKTHEFVLVYDGVRGPAWEQHGQDLQDRLGDKIRRIGFKNAFGESVCLMAGFERSRGKVLITSPQYVQIDPTSMGDMLDAIEQGADFVTPLRTGRVDPILNRLQSSIFNLIMRTVVRMDFHDLNCYFRAIRREVLEDVTIYGDMYRFLPVIAYRQGYRVVEVPVRHQKEWGRAGFFGVGVYVRRFLDIVGVVFLTKFTLKPLRFFGSVGALIFLFGSFILTWLTIRKFWFEAGLYNAPAFLLGLMLVVLGVQIIGFGLVGEIIIYTQAKNLREYRIERIWE